MNLKLRASITAFSLAAGVALASQPAIAGTPAYVTKLLIGSCQTVALGSNWRPTIGAVAFGTRYALCEVHDQNTGNEYLMRWSGADFEFVAAGKPAFSVQRMVDLGVPAAEASKLLATLNAQLQSARP